jgi:hypothetical protein
MIFTYVFRHDESMTKSKFLDPKKVVLHLILGFFENPVGSYTHNLLGWW